MKIVREFPRRVRSIEHAWIPMPDGVRLAARIWLPEDAEQDPVPGILELIPYRKRDFTRGRDEPMQPYLAGHGYAVVRVDVRGTGDSEGLLTDEYSEPELDDAIQIIAWMARQPWSTGAVGMTGISWGGFNCLQVAARRPPELKAILTLCSSDDRYADDAHYMGGCLLNENLTWGSVLTSFQTYPPDPAIVGERWRDIWRERLENAVLFPALWMRHPRRDHFWKRGSVCEDYGAIECPVYAIGGWADGYSNAVPRLIAGLKGPRKGLVGPWAHQFPHDALPGPAIGFLQEALRWWDFWLKGLETGVMEEPVYRVWIQDWAPPASFHMERPGRWAAEESWPSPRIRDRFFLTSDRTLVEGRSVEERALRHRSPQTVGIDAGDWCGFGAEGEAPGGQRAEDGRSLTFDSAPLAAPLEVLGAPRVTLEFAVDRPAAMLAIRVNDVAPDGSSLRVTYGLINLIHRQTEEEAREEIANRNPARADDIEPTPCISHETAAALEPGRRTRLQVQLNDCAHVFAAGHRVRLAISTSYWPIAWPAPEPVILTLFAGATTLSLPERPPRPADALLRPFDEPEEAPPIECAPLRPAHYRRVIERDLPTDEVVYTIYSEGDAYSGAVSHIRDIDLDLGFSILRRYRIGRLDPLSACAEVEQQTTFRRADWNVEIRTKTSCRSTVSEFVVEGQIEAFDDGKVFFEKRWDERVPRDTA